MTREWVADHAMRVGAVLGEGPIWVDDSLWFVDIKSRRIHCHVPGSDILRSWEAPEYVGWVLPARRGGLIAGLQTGPHHFDPASGRFDRLAHVDAHLPANRLNDAAVDDDGHVWFGTMDNEEANATGHLYRWDGAQCIDTGAAPVIITNGPAIAPSGKLLYHVDTLGRRVIRHTIGSNKTLDGGEVFLSFDAADGYPDGAVCDAEGGIWLGFYAGWEARRYSAQGRLTTRVRFPVANVTKVTLGGADGCTAWATTASKGLSDAALRQQPLAGDLFTFRVEVPAAPLAYALSYEAP